MSKLGFSSLLTTGNPKINKSNNSGKGYFSAIMHFAPAHSSGHEVCWERSDGCTEACLNTAGRGRYQAIQDVRIARTRYFIEYRDKFLGLLTDELDRFIRKCKRLKLKPAVRLNGTSDIPWETMGGGILAAYPNVQFYDYTKITARMLRWCEGKLPSNYHLTFSRSESNEVSCRKVLYAGGNIAVVFKGIQPKYFGYGLYYRPVINGDLTDQRFLDGYKVIVGLTAKGRGKHDRSGFVL
jgi:hypothetical protein